MPAPRQDLGGRLARATRQLIDAERPILARHELTMWQYVVLSRLARGPAASQRALAQDVAHEPSRLIAVLTALERSGLVTRRPDPSDTRARVIELTDAGRRRHAAAQAEIHAMEDVLLAGASRAERAALDGMLRRLAPDRPGAGEPAGGV